MLWFLLSCVRTFQVGEAPVDTAPDSPVDDTAADDTGEVPTVCVPGTNSAWRLPSPRWGLGALHTERRLEEADLPLDANFLLALGWQATRYGCADFGGDIEFSFVGDYWGTGWCGYGTVTNHGSEPATWEARVDASGTLNNYWSSTVTVEGDTWVFTGNTWNATLDPGETVTFGWCAAY